MDEKKQLIFYNDGKRFQGYILSQDETHFRIEETISNKIILLPKLTTRMEEM